MKKCHYCGEEFDEELTVCPACGKEQPENVPVPGEAEASPDTAQEAAAEVAVPVEAAQNASESTPAADAQSAPEAAPVKKGVASASAIALGAAIVLLLAAILAVLILNGKDTAVQPEALASEAATQTAESTEAAETTEATIPADGNPDDVTCKGSYTVSDEEVKAANGEAVATAGDSTLTNGQLQILYWRSVQNFYAQYGTYAQYFGLDHTQSMDTQVCGVADGLTWEQYFLQDALNNWTIFEAVAQQAREAGFQMSDENREQMNTMEEGLLETATNNGFTDITAMIARNFGAGATLEDYKSFWEMYFLSSDYYNEITGSFAPTTEEIAEYFNTHEAEYADNGLDKTTSSVDVRHILILPEGATIETVTTEEFSDEAWAAGEQKAQEILDQWLSGDKTEDSFATLANENSADTGSNTNGGLYSGVTEGQMVEAFNDWCFDSSRQVGDYGIVKTQYGYHIMYFCGSQLLWESQAESDLLAQLSNDFINNAVEAADVKIDYSAIKLGFVDMT
ncbi:MAG: peptidylprolyl isomerase [Eubacteriales bacterium]|nr:peptidylprolyl isomerase [Clostridiales bacterium]MDD6372032.1 peptidylprolyl isomerase [Eubacteriales bacterium]